MADQIPTDIPQSDDVRVKLYEIAKARAGVYGWALAACVVMFVSLGSILCGTDLLNAWINESTAHAAMIFVPMALLFVGMILTFGLRLNIDVPEDPIKSAN